MRDKINKFMQGRYGVDQFARFTLGVALFLRSNRIFYENEVLVRWNSGHAGIYTDHLHILPYPFQKCFCTLQ